VREAKQRLAFLLRQIEEQARAAPLFSGLAEPMRLARRCDLHGVKAIHSRAVEKAKLHISAGLVLCHVGGPPS
jgi:hypothetical protein